jgi:hypothetical protein
VGLSAVEKEVGMDNVIPIPRDTNRFARLASEPAAVIPLDANGALQIKPTREVIERHEKRPHSRLSAWLMLQFGKLVW